MMLPICVKADHIYSIDMDIHIEKDGTANITEVWDVKADDGSEWYKTMYDLGESKFYNYEVYMIDTYDLLEPIHIFDKYDIFDKKLKSSKQIKIHNKIRK